MKKYAEMTIEEKAKCVACLLHSGFNEYSDRCVLKNGIYHWTSDYVDYSLTAEELIKGFEATYSAEEIEEGLSTFDEIPEPVEASTIDYGIKPSKIAAFVIATAMLEARDCNYCVRFSKIEKFYGSELKDGWSKNESFIKAIVEELEKYPAVSDAPIETYDECFDINLYTDYIADPYNADEE